MRDTTVRIPPTIFSHCIFLFSAPSRKKFVNIIRNRPNASVVEHSTARTLGKSRNKEFTTDIIIYEARMNSIVAVGSILFIILVRFSNAGVGVFIRD